MSVKEEKKRIHVYYSGTVQGVGFRFTAEKIAAGLGLSGWVKNLPDGRVEMVCEGQESDLQRVLEKIEHYFSRYIRKKDISWQQYRGEFVGFDIRFF